MHNRCHCVQVQTRCCLCYAFAKVAWSVVMGRSLSSPALHLSGRWYHSTAVGMGRSDTSLCASAAVHQRGRWRVARGRDHQGGCGNAPDDAALLDRVGEGRDSSSLGCEVVTRCKPCDPRAATVKSSTCCRVSTMGASPCCTRMSITSPALRCCDMPSAIEWHHFGAQAIAYFNSAVTAPHCCLVAWPFSPHFTSVDSDSHCRSLPGPFHGLCRDSGSRRSE